MSTPYNEVKLVVLPNGQLGLSRGTTRYKKQLIIRDNAGKRASALKRRLQAKIEARKNK